MLYKQARRCYRNEHGLETIEAAALIAVALALLLGISLAISGNGTALGDTLLHKLGGWITNPAQSTALTQAQPVNTTSSLSTATLGIPGILQSQPVSTFDPALGTAALSISALALWAAQASPVSAPGLLAQAGGWPAWLVALLKVLGMIVIGIIALVILAAIIYAAAAVLAALGIGAGITFAAALIIAGIKVYSGLCYTVGEQRRHRRWQDYGTARL